MSDVKFGSCYITAARRRLKHFFLMDVDPGAVANGMWIEIHTGRYPDGPQWARMPLTAAPRAQIH